MKDIRLLSLQELEEIVISYNEKPFRAKQVYEWLWKKRVNSFKEMKNVPDKLLKQFSDDYYIPVLEIINVQKDADGTQKLAFKTSTNQIIEGVLIPSKDRNTACISTQAGCALECAFCATGKLKFEKNLTAAEIFDQIYELNNISIKQSGKGLSNIVYMGMGEPLLNLDSVLASIEIITSKLTFGYSPSRITVSTVGLPEQIRALGDLNIKFNLAVSLHSASNEIRSSMMPINRKHDLEQLSESLIYFHLRTKARVTFEYLLLQNVNDRLVDAKLLTEFCKVVPCKINIIEYNPVEGIAYKKSITKNIDEFVSYVESKNLIVNVRRSRGKNIDAACGQLANKNINR